MSGICGIDKSVPGITRAGSIGLIPKLYRTLSGRMGVGVTQA